MVQSVPAAYSAKNLSAQRTPVYVLEIDDDRSPPTDPVLFSTHPVYDMVGSPPVRTVVTTTVCMELPRGIEAQVEPHRGRSSIGSVTCPLVDKDGGITALITGVASPILGTIGGKSATLKSGFIDIAYSDYIRVAQGIIEGYRLTPDLTTYELTLRDSTALQNRKVFNVATSRLSGAIDADDTTIPIMDGSEFELPAIIRIDDEFLSFTGITTDGVAPPEATRYSVDFGNSKFLSLAYQTSPTALRIAESTDGIAWHEILASSLGNSWRCIFYVAAHSRWLAGMNGSLHVTSPMMYSDDDGRHWTAIAAPSASRIFAFAYSPSLDRLIAVGDSATGAYIISSDNGGLTWTQRVNDATRTLWNAAAWDETLDLFIVVSNANRLTVPGPKEEIATSPNGTTTWTYIFAPTAGLFTDVATDNLGHIVIVGTAGAVDSVVTSSNGTTFTHRTPAVGNDWASIVKANSWVAVSNVSTDTTHQVMISDDNGVTWTSKATPVFNQWQKLAYNSTGHVLVAVASTTTQAGSGIMYSLDDGDTWHIAGSFASGATRGLFQSTAASHTGSTTVQEVIHIGPSHPMDIVVDVCENTNKSGAGIDPDFVDEAGFAALKTTIGSTYQMEFFIYAASNAKTWIEDEIYAVMGLYPKITGDGKISAKLMSPPGAADATLSHDDIVQILAWDGNFTTSLFNSITINYDLNTLTGELQATKTEPREISISNYGLKPLIINSNGLLASLSGTATLINSITDNLLTRYANTAPLVQLRVFLSKHLIEPGDIVAVTSALLPNPSTGTRGVTAAKMEVISRAIVFDQGYVDLTLLWVSWGA